MYSVDYLHQISERNYKPWSCIIKLCVLFNQDAIRTCVYFHFWLIKVKTEKLECIKVKNKQQQKIAIFKEATPLCLWKNFIKAAYFVKRLCTKDEQVWNCDWDLATLWSKAQDAFFLLHGFILGTVQYNTHIAIFSNMWCIRGVLYNNKRHNRCSSFCSLQLFWSSPVVVYCEVGCKKSISRLQYLLNMFSL